MSQIGELEKRLGHDFSTQSLLIEALSHRSYEQGSNERLEFLGDSIIGFIMAEYIYNRFGTMPEGDMSRMCSQLVNGQTLSEVALMLGLDGGLLLGAGEAKSGGYKRPSILADTLEAVIAAIYLDSDLKTVCACVMQWFDTRLVKLSNDTVIKDAKSTLQERLQASKQALPEYVVVSISGPAHEQVFVVECRVQGFEFIGKGEQTSRKRAEQLSAQDFIRRLDQHE